MGLFDNKVGIVTGAASGIGRASAVAYAREGAAVVLADVESAQMYGEEVVASIREAGSKATFVATDVSDIVAVKNLVDTTISIYGRLDFAYNNAGIVNASGAITEIDESTFDRIIAVNLKGVWTCMKYEILYMKRHSGGVIVNAASEVGLVGAPLASVYCASKHGVIGLTKSAASEYANMSIRINAVAPGAIATPMILNQPQVMQDMVMAPQPMHRFGTPEEVAELVLWLSSDRSSFVTGAVFSIDGGATSNIWSYDPMQSPAVETPYSMRSSQDPLKVNSNEQVLK